MDVSEQDRMTTARVERFQANPYGGGVNDEFFRFNIPRDATVKRDLGVGDDVVEISADYAVKYVRLPFTSVEVGNDLALDSNTMVSQDGGLVVRLQAEDDAGALVGAVSRFDDQGITFESNANFTFDLRDLVSGVQRGDQFDVVELGTSGDDKFNEAGETEAHYINAGMGNDRLIGGLNKDFLVGEIGSDRLDGRQGDDALLGGADADVFVFKGETGNDRIIDFVSGVGKIDLSAFDIDFGDIQTNKSGTETLIAVNSDADAACDFQVRLANGATPVEADYIFA